jgi:hypothetical protein
VAEKKIVTTKYGERPLVVVETADAGNVDVWAGSVVLRRDLYKAKEVGDDVDIACLGKREAKNGNSYNAYDVN